MDIVAKTFAGFEEILAIEIESLGGQNVRVGSRAVKFTGNNSILYKVNYLSRFCVRVLVPIFQGEAKDEEGLYKLIYDYDWSPYLDPEKTFAIDCTSHSTFFTHSLYASYKVKDAIVDQIRDKVGERPDVDLDLPDIRINIHIYEQQISVALDSSGSSLHKRGYRRKKTIAPINEALAACLIEMSGWDKRSPFLDPMCGSGTFLVEAARMAGNIPPQSPSREFAFMRWPDYDKTIWRMVLDNAKKAKTMDKIPEIIGQDSNIAAIRASEINIREAGLHKHITLQRQNYFYTRDRQDKTHIVVNPPYDKRITSDDINLFYKKIGDTLKTAYTGSEAWIMSGNLEALRHIGLRPEKKIKVLNGPIDSLFCQYKMYQGTKRDFSKMNRKYAQKRN